MCIRDSPITYELFAGNTNDCLTYRPNFGRIKKEFDLGRVISVADKGMTTGDNIWYTINTPTKDGYVFSMSVRGADKEMKKYVLEEEGYTWLGTEYKRKSRKYPRTIQVTSQTGRKLKKTVHEKQVVFWSEKYAKRAKADRAAALAKAADLANNPGSYTRATSYGAAKYVKKIDYDKDTGEILTASSILEIDETKLRDEEALDGYYAVSYTHLDVYKRQILYRILRLVHVFENGIGRRVHFLFVLPIKFFQQSAFLLFCFFLLEQHLSPHFPL